MSGKRAQKRGGARLALSQREERPSDTLPVTERTSEEEESGAVVPHEGDRYRNLQIALFFTALLVMAALSWIPALHPKESEAEKRELAVFPSFSTQALFSGEYTSDINTWFADTFPFRDTFVTMNGAFRALLSPSDTAVHGEVEQGDDIPDEPNTDDPPKGEEKEDEPLPEGIQGAHEIVEPDMAEVPVETLGAILIAGDTAYEYYNFSKEAADLYASSLSRAASLLAGKADVYDMIVPTSMDITLPASVRQNVNSADQKKAMEYIYGSMSEQVKGVEIYDTLRAHRDEYIFYRTDHHWTALGAYYAYTQYCARRGVKPAPLDTAFTKAEYPGFLGSFYNDSKKNPALGGNPDTVLAYIPNDTNKISITQNDGTPLNWNIVTDVTKWNSGAKYSAFIGGDNAYSVIENPNRTDGSACIVIKESFGNAFVPFLVPDYQRIYVVDYRYFAKVRGEKLSGLVDATGAKDVLFINNVSATRNGSLMKAVAAFVG